MPNPLILIAITIVVGIVVGTVVGMYVGRWTYGNVLASCDRADWCEFNAGLGAVAYGMIAGAIAYVASGLAIIFHCPRSGHRVGYILGHSTATPVLALLLTLTVLKLFYT